MGPSRDKGQSMAEKTRADGIQGDVHKLLDETIR